MKPLIDTAELERECTATLKAGGSTLELSADMLRHVATRVSAELAQLDARLKALESRRSMSFEGPHDPAKTYGTGCVVQRSGAAWVALCSTSESPGASAHWRRIAGGAA